MVVEYTKQILTAANIVHIGKIEIETIEHIYKPANNILRITCPDQQWVLENAFEERKTDFNIFVYLRNTLNKVLAHYGKCFLDYGQICYYHEGINTVEHCISYDIFFTAEQREWFDKSIKSYNFAKKLHESKEKTYKNICIRMSEVRFESKLSYRLLTENFTLNQANRFITDTQSFIYDDYIDIGKKIFASSKFTDASDI